VIGGVEASPSESNRRCGPLALELIVAVVAHNSFFRVSHLALDLPDITATWTFIFIYHLITFSTILIASIIELHTEQGGRSSIPKSIPKVTFQPQLEHIYIGFIT
jgi:hypothetical protein